MGIIMDHPEGLKPCPFCGETEKALLQRDSKYCFKVQCQICGAMIQGDFKDQIEEQTGTAIEAWNKRI